MAEERPAWLSLTVRERRYITIIREGEAEASTSAGRGHGRNSNNLNSYLLIPAVSVFVVPFLAPAIALAVAIIAGQTDKPDPSDCKAGAAILKINESDLSGIDFGIQGWEHGVVYAVNPVEPTTYRPLASFHEDLLLHKINELERILNGLGARRYSIHHVRSKRRSGSGRIRAFSNELSARSESGATSLRSWTGTTEGHAPQLPGDLAWYPHEREWQALAESRLTGTRKEFSLVVQQDEDFGVDARLAASVKAAGLEIGGRYSSVEHVRFEVEGTF